VKAIKNLVKDKYVIKEVNIISRVSEEKEKGQIIILKPIFKSKIWGGNKIKKMFSYTIDECNIGECWGISAHANGNCKIQNGQFKGWTLARLWREKKELFGNYKAKEFPLLVKIIDAKNDLSIQVHPDDTYAKIAEKDQHGKNECWYVLDCKKNATIINGHMAKTKKELITKIENRKWEELLNEVPIAKGDFIQINAGTMHAIKKGTMILEIQQSSDLTYRVYDYDRLFNGEKRELHLKKALEVINVPSKHMKVLKTANGKQIQSLVDCDYFTVFKIEIKERFTILQKNFFLLVTVIEGNGKVNNKSIKAGVFFIIPNTEDEYVFEGNLKIIISTVK